MPTQALKRFLGNNHVKYTIITHSPEYTAQEIAASAHIPGKDLAKTVIVKIDGDFAMAVLPASMHVSLTRLKEASGAGDAEIARNGCSAEMTISSHQASEPWVKL